MINDQALHRAREEDRRKPTALDPAGEPDQGLAGWRFVDHLPPHLGPPTELWEWFEEHPDGYEFFRGKYHEYLNPADCDARFGRWPRAGLNENFTLLHQGDTPARIRRRRCMSI